MSTKFSLSFALALVLATLAAGCAANQNRPKSEEGWYDCSAGECTHDDADQLEVVMTPPAGSAKPAPSSTATRGGGPQNAKK